MFGIFKLFISKRPVTTSSLRTSKRERTASQPPLSPLAALSSLCAPRMGRLPLQLPLSLFPQLRLLQSALFLKLPSPVCILGNVCLIYEIYLITKFLAHCHVKMLRRIIV